MGVVVATSVGEVHVPLRNFSHALHFSEMRRKLGSAMLGSAMEWARISGRLAGLIGPSRAMRRAADMSASVLDGAEGHTRAMTRAPPILCEMA